MSGRIKGVILIFLIIANSWKLFGQDIKFRHLNINDWLPQNTVFENLKGQKWILINYASFQMQETTFSVGLFPWSYLNLLMPETLK